MKFPALPHCHHPSELVPAEENCQLQKLVDLNKLVATKRQGWVNALIFCLESSEVYNGLDEDGVVSYVGVFRVQFGEWAEERAATCDVHVTDRPLEGRGGDVGPEGINNVLPVVLVEQH